MLILILCTVGASGTLRSDFDVVLLQTELKIEANKLGGASTLTSTALKPKPTAASEEKDIGFPCDEDRWLPEHFLLGIQKGGSSSITDDLIDAGVTPALSKWSTITENEQEFHFFDQWYDGQSRSVDDLRRELLREAPSCPGTNFTKRLLADFTPINLALVPFPNGAEPTGNAYGLDQNNRVGVNLPEMLADLYGRHAKSLSFAIILREPLARMQSSWYHAQTTDFDALCKDCKAPNFTSALGVATAEALESPPKYQDWLWVSMYAPQLETWLEHFDARQFFFITQDEYIRNGSGTLCHALAEWHRRDLACIHIGESQQLNSHSHPDLAAEGISDELDLAFKRVMDPFNDRLVQVLTAMHAKGASMIGLPSFAGTGGIGAWLGW